ncbi:MAG: tripartite tricarboxylate transporter substrate binding protein [Burkholderiales bacterium]
MPRIRRVCAGLYVVAALGPLQPLHAQNYPARPVRLIIPFSPGGATDVPGRILAQKLSEFLGQQVIVDNRPGAGSTIGTDLVAKAPADGYTLLLTATPFVIGAGLYKNLPYDPLRDFAPVMQVGSAPNVLVVHPSLPARSVKDLIALARAQPDKIDFASSGNGSAQHLFGVLFTSLATICLTHIPYKGSAPATTDLISGQVSVGFPGIAIALPHTAAGRLRPLGVTSAQRSPQMPSVPTIAEAGVPGYAATLWLGIAAPEGTPKAIIERLHANITKVLQAPDLHNAFSAAGTDVVASNPEAFGALIKSELAKWVKVVRESGAQVN